ncbi:MAG: hypothetical protein WAT91_13550, partial [Saprospiraceae bacterium]
MKKKNFTILSNGQARNIWLACLLLLGSITSALASYTVTCTSPQTIYTPGVNNTFTYSVAVTTDGTVEYVDNIKFAYPVGVTVVSGTGPSPYNFCGGGQGNYSFAANTVQWITPGHPTGCGAFASGTFNFSVTVAIPAGQTGPMVVTFTSEGDGWPPPLTDAQVTNIPITYAMAIPFVPCALVCPANITLTLDPGACSAFVNYTVPTTGTCLIGGSVTGFSGAYAPSAINYYQYDAG